MFITELSSGQQTHSLGRVRESPVSRSLPRHFKVAGQAPQSAQSYYDITKDKLFVAKSISLICQVSYAFAAQVFLSNLYKYITSNQEICFKIILKILIVLISSIDVFHVNQDLA